MRLRPDPLFRGNRTHIWDIRGALRARVCSATFCLRAFFALILDISSRPIRCALLPYSSALVTPAPNEEAFVIAASLRFGLPVTQGIPVRLFVFVISFLSESQDFYLGRSTRVLLPGSSLLSFAPGACMVNVDPDLLYH